MKDWLRRFTWLVVTLGALVLVGHVDRSDLTADDSQGDHCCLCHVKVVGESSASTDLRPRVFVDEILVFPQLVLESFRGVVFELPRAPPVV